MRVRTLPGASGPDVSPAPDDPARARVYGGHASLPVSAHWAGARSAHVHWPSAGPCERSASPRYRRNLARLTPLGPITGECADKAPFLSGWNPGVAPAGSITTSRFPLDPGTMDVTIG